MNLRAPTANKRLNELIGFLLLTLGVLLALSLVSYSPLDPSLNVFTPGRERPHNFIGVAGSYTADLFLQLLGLSALVLPAVLLVLSVRWFRGQKVESPVAKAIGVVLLILSFSALLMLLPSLPRLRETIPPGGLLGILLADWLLGTFNPTGAYIVALSSFFVSLFLATSFSFSGTSDWFARHFAFVGAWRARYVAWREAREKRNLQIQVEKTKIAGRPPVPPQTIVSKERPKTGEGTLPAALTLVRRGAEEGAASPEVVLPEVEKRAAPKVTKGAVHYRMPSPALLRAPELAQAIDEEELKQRAVTLIEKAEEFDVKGVVTQINPGPVVTTYEFKPEAGIKYSRITNLVDDLCLALRAESILIERIPGKSTVGIEVPNPHRQTIHLREIIESQEFVSTPSRLTVALGLDITGRVRVADLTQMPHLLIAGSTGSGKSVSINSMIISMLYKANPEEVKFILVDPKRLELGLYENIPHLHTPIVTDPKLAANALRNATREMERRLKLLAQRGVRNIEQYNRLFTQEKTLSLFADLEEEESQPLPYIVIVIDELADLMMIDSPNVEESITRLAQMARAVGIHLILATQRPSVDVITGLIKANFAARISFRVASKVDSRTILDANGAEALLGRGDMLYLPPGSSRLHRVHGALVTESEIVHVCDFWRAQSKPSYNEEFLKFPKDAPAATDEGGETEEVDDELYDDAVRVVCEMGRASTSTLQRRLRIGYGRAARLIDMMQQDGIVGPPDGSRPREVLKKLDYFKEFDESLK